MADGRGSQGGWRGAHSSPGCTGRAGSTGQRSHLHNAAARQRTCSATTSSTRHRSAPTGTHEGRFSSCSGLMSCSHCGSRSPCIWTSPSCQQSAVCCRPVSIITLHVAHLLMRVTRGAIKVKDCVAQVPHVQTRVTRSAAAPQQPGTSTRPGSPRAQPGSARDPRGGATSQPAATGEDCPVLSLKLAVAGRVPSFSCPQYGDALHKHAPRQPSCAARLSQGPSRRCHLTASHRWAVLLCLLLWRGAAQGLIRRCTVQLRVIAAQALLSRQPQVGSQRCCVARAVENQ